MTRDEYKKHVVGYQNPKQPFIFIICSLNENHLIWVGEYGRIKAVGSTDKLITGKFPLDVDLFSSDLFVEE